MPIVGKEATWMDDCRTAAGEGGKLLCSLVDGFEGEDSNGSCGHIVEIPGFGRIFLGETAGLVRFRATGGDTRRAGLPGQGENEYLCGRRRRPGRQLAKLAVLLAGMLFTLSLCGMPRIDKPGTRGAVPEHLRGLLARQPGRGASARRARRDKEFSPTGSANSPRGN